MNSPLFADFDCGPIIGTRPRRVLNRVAVRTALRAVPECHEPTYFYFWLSTRRERGETADPAGADLDNAAVSEKEIDQYLASLDEPKRATLAQLRDTILAIVPDAEQCISYGMPAFKLRGKTIAGICNT